jgi:FdrA protein
LPIKTIIKKSAYHDSVSLMLVAKELAKAPGVADAAVVMATEANKGILKEAGLLSPEAEAASPNDLVIAVSGEASALPAALSLAEALLQKKASASDEPGNSAFQPQTLAAEPRSLRNAVKANPSANVAVISVAGRYAAAEAWDALHHGLHVLLFSDNVSLEDELALKRYAVDHGLLLMGPGAGTAILNGVALGFANAVPRGPVGIVSAAGTGLQEVSTLLARQGVGISQGIGTGGRDLKEAVGGLMMLSGLQALQADPATRVIVLVSKPPSPPVAEKILSQARQSDKPTVVCFLGQAFTGKNITATLEETAFLAAGLADPNTRSLVSEESRQPRRPGEKASAGKRYLRALFSGGTLCYEAQVIWRKAVKQPVFSNAPLIEACRLQNSNRSHGHSAIDLGEEEFTVGRPHPMIDNDLRIRRLFQEARDPETAVILLDVVLGYGAHPDPASELAPAITKAREIASGREIAFVASVTGTEADPQCRSRQVAALEAASVVVCESNAAAARLAAKMINKDIQS